MKHWKHAPEWAQYRAQDMNGRWCWHEQRPIADHLQTMWGHGGKSRLDTEGTPEHPEPNPEWADTLESRPLRYRLDVTAIGCFLGVAMLGAGAASGVSEMAYTGVILMNIWAAAEFLRRR